MASFTCKKCNVTVEGNFASNAEAQEIHDKKYHASPTAAQERLTALRARLKVRREMHVAKQEARKAKKAS